ncbi:MAG: hypothetical protein JST54_11280 [Deltaproteobacteria bacterium]|nr:hypothetical protein [Deltaproteobacteria bacterium]
MSRSNSPSSSAHAGAPKTVDEALGPLTQKAVDDAADALNKKFLAEARGIGVGLATLLIGPNDKQDQAVLDLLAEANVGKGDLQQLVSLGGALITAAADRDAAEAAAKAATLKLEAARTKLHDASTSFSNLARAKLGAQSSALDKFGIKSIGGRKGMKRAPKKGGSGSNSSGSTPNDAGSTPKS